jgi:hypothetical protein
MITRKYILVPKKENFFIRHWCCINEKPITTETQTKVEYATHVVSTKIKVCLIKQEQNFQINLI